MVTPAEIDVGPKTEVEIVHVFKRIYQFFGVQLGPVRFSASIIICASIYPSRET